MTEPRSELEIGHYLGSPDDRQFVTALARGVAIMRCFRSNRPILSVTELARLTGLPQPTVWRLCHTLKELGLLVQAEGTDRLRVGLGVLGLGLSALPSTDIDQLARAEMDRMANQFRVAVSLCVPDQTNMLIMERALGTGALLLNLSVGSRFEMVRSTPGVAYLASLGPEAREQTYRLLATRYEEKWPAHRERLESLIPQFEQHGFVGSIGLLTPQIGSVACPIILEQDTSVFVLTCGGPVDVIGEPGTLQQIGQAIRNLAQRIGEALRTGGAHGYSTLTRISNQTTQKRPK